MVFCEFEFEVCKFYIKYSDKKLVAIQLKCINNSSFYNVFNNQFFFA